MARPDLKKHCTGYGFLGAFTAIVCAVSWFLVDSKGDECIRASYDHLQVSVAIHSTLIRIRIAAC